jgi:acyl carrier protein/SAM-dependent methyltransferase
LLMAGDPLERMDEQRFWRGLAAKIEVSVRMVQAFAHLPLDFVLFFSSIQALERTQRQANYAAGCTVEDAFAARLAREWNCSVRVVNWGYWGSVGFAAISSGYRNWIAQAGMGSVEPAEGMAALERLLSGPHRQLAFLKTQRPDALKGVRFSDYRLSRVPDAAPIVPLDAPVDTDVSRLTTQGLPERFESLLLELLRHELDGLGLFGGIQEPAGASAVAPQFHAWLRHTQNLLAQRQMIVERDGGWRLAGSPSTSSPWQEWERCAAEWRTKPDLAAPVQLADATLRELRHVLSGKRAATDVLFPKSSPHLVEGIYRDSPVPDFFNQALCTVLARYIERRRRIAPDVRLRILEIGAGTGGTTSPLIKALEPYTESIADYRFTDISKAFVVAAESEFGSRAPYMSYGTFDVERALETQGIVAGQFDIVVAANVLHATSDIARTLRNTKAALKRNGLLLLNEVCDTSLFAHVTFGLLKGWWLYEDAHLRIPGSPALSPESWRSVLAGQGFNAIELPVESARTLGQQIVVAMSDGWICQAAGSSVSIVRNAEARPAPTPVVPAEAPLPSDGTLADALEVRSVVRQTLATTLGIDLHAMRDDAPLSDYGLDSMLAVQAVEILNTSVGIDLTTTSLFDYPSIDAIVAHIQSARGVVTVYTQGADVPGNESAATKDRSEPARSTPPAAATTSDGINRAIVQALVDIAGVDRSDIRSDVEFVDYGIDSMLAVQIVEDLNQRLNVELTTTGLFDHTTIDALVAHIAVSFNHGESTAVAVDASPLLQAQPLHSGPESVRASVGASGTLLRSRVVQELSAVLEIDVSEIDARTPFTDYGLDSMLAVQWVERLNQALQLELTTTSPFDYPTVDDLMLHITQGREADGAHAAMEAAPQALSNPVLKRQAQPLSYTI